MNNNSERLIDPDGEILPVVCGPRWFGPEPKPFILRIEQPLAFEEMVAALYSVAEPDEIGSAEELCGSVVVTLVLEGLPGIEDLTRRLRRDEERGTVESPEFLTLCRRRVAELLGTRR
jgi:hypothetical protein